MSERIRYILVFAICLGFSFGGVVLSAFRNQYADGGRGGAIAVALAFATIFMGRGYGSVPIEALLRRLSRRARTLPGQEGLKGTDARLEELNSDVQAIARSLRASQSISIRNTTEQNAYLAASSVIGTLVWGFGDWAAEWLATLAKVFHLL